MKDLRNRVLKKLSAKMSEISIEMQEAADLGKAAFEAGKKRVPAQDKKLLELIGKSKGVAGFASKFMGEWLKAWDKANLSEKVASRLSKEEKMSIDDAWDILYESFLDKTEVVKPDFKLDMKIDKEKKQLLRSIYDNAPVKKLYTYSTNMFGFKIDELRVDVEHGNLKIQKITE